MTIRWTNEELDALVLGMLMVNVATPFRTICARLQIDPGSTPSSHGPDYFREVDRALQRLRKRGHAQFAIGQGWVLGPNKITGGAV